MNFLSKTFSTLTGTSIPYDFKEKVVDPISNPDHRNFVWTIYNGSNPKNKSDISIFEFNLKDPYNISRDFEQLARNCFKKGKLIKHPGVLSIIDFIENDNFLYIVTEAVRPLKNCLETDDNFDLEDYKLYGLYNIGKTMEFINNNANCLHGSLNSETSIFVNAAGDWKLFGFELLTNLASDPEQTIYRNSRSFPGFDSLTSPEVKDGGIESIKRFPFKFDSFLFGSLIYQVFSSRTFKISDSTISSTQNLNMTSIPKQMQSSLKKLIKPELNARITIEKFFVDLKRFFESNKLIKLSMKLEELQFTDEVTKSHFLCVELAEYIPDHETKIGIPSALLEKKLLPLLIQFYNTVSASHANDNASTGSQMQQFISPLLHYIMKIGSGLNSVSFDLKVKPIIIKAFSSSDRSIRLNLLNSLPSYAAHLNSADLSSGVLYNILSGFQDTNFMIREATLKSIYLIVDKLTVKQINQDLLRYLAKSQVDLKPSIRTNTIVIIIKISDKIYKTSRNSVLITALGKSLKDSFVPCKMTALSGFESLIDTFTLEDICNKVLGHLAVSLMDPKSYKVRTESKRVFNLFLSKVEEFASTLPRDEEEDDDLEERQFYENNVPKTAEESEMASNSESYFKWNLVNKLISSSSISGQLEESYNNATPESSKLSVVNTEAKSENSASVLINDESGWDDDFDFDVNEALSPSESSKIDYGAQKLMSSSRNSGPSKGLKLSSKKKNKSTPLKLDLGDDGKAEDGWGDLDEW